MPILSNAFPLHVPDISIPACKIPYDKASIAELQKTLQSTHFFYKQGNAVLVFSTTGNYPFTGELQEIGLKDNFHIFCFLVKSSIRNYLSTLGRYPIGFHPIELVSIKKDDDLLSKIIADYPFKIFVKYTIDTRIIQGNPCLVIDCSTRKFVKDNCKFFLEKGFDLQDLSVATIQKDGHRKYFGHVKSIDGEWLFVELNDGTTEKINSIDAYLIASRENFDKYLRYVYGKQHDTIAEQIRLIISVFNNGENKYKRINIIKKNFQDTGLVLIGGTPLVIEECHDYQTQSIQLDKPVFIFNDNGQSNWAETGISQYGPYTKRTFDRNNPAICVICAQHAKGSVEQFVRKLLKGIPSSKYFGNGLEGKFNVGTSRVEIFVTLSDDVNSYKTAIEQAIRKKSDEGGRWDLALVQVRESYKQLSVKENPYYWGKSLFFLHQIPVQDFTMELLDQSDYSLGYSLNNMALACYSKMGGIPWLLKSSPTISHELVIGIGSANVKQDAASQRIMGITTVFSGNGSYIVSNKSKAVAPEDYCSALTTVLSDTIQKIRKPMNWQEGDTIRLIFHASVKLFNKDEIKAIKAVMSEYRDYHIEYAFLKISEDHGLHLFDTATSREKKGKLAPLRGKMLALSKNEMLIYLIGQKQLRQETDGHPRGIILSLHKESTFKDIKYLTIQFYGFASHSWRSYFPNPMPVTISYSDLIARNLGWLNQLPEWNDAIMFGKIGQSQWFL